MLCLTRRKNQSVIITVGDVRVTVEIVEARGDGKVKLGLTGPDHVTFHRHEIQELVDQEAIRRANGNHRDGGIEP